MAIGGSDVVQAFASTNRCLQDAAGADTDSTVCAVHSHADLGVLGGASASR